MIKAEAKNVRLTSRKARLVMDLVRGKDTEEAIRILKVMPQKAAPIILKTLKSALANAKQQGKEAPMYIAKSYINAGPIIKRMMPRARGRTNIIHKKISHVTIFLDERSK